MAQIIPAILEKNAFEFNRKAKILSEIPGVTRVHLDFADGEFVQNSTIEVSEIDALNPAITWEAHLMLFEPKDFLDLKIAGVKNVLVHAESYSSTIDLRKALESIKKAGMEPGISMKLNTALELAVVCSDITKHIQLMSIEPGFQGSPFNEKIYTRLQELRSRIPDAVIEVDGGVSPDNVNQLVKAGADLLVSGSGIWKGDPKKNFELLNQKL